jgi:adenosine kinase
MKNILVIGSIAYDHIMSFNGSFKDDILAGSLEHLSLSFLANSRKTFFGGCSANISYSLRLLGDNPLIFGVLGSDYAEYIKWLSSNDIETKHIEIDKQSLSAAAFILSDENQNQISIFSPGAMGNLELAASLDSVDLAEIDLVILAPDVPQRMIKIAEHLISKKIPYVFDPGQAVTGLSKEYLTIIISGCSGIIANEYEIDLLSTKLKVPLNHLVNWVDFLIETVGEEGSYIFEGGKKTHIPAIGGIQAVDVTGCGDAFRAGFLHSYSRGMDLATCCKYGSTVASFVIDQVGTQTHEFSYKDFKARLRRFYDL